MSSPSPIASVDPVTEAVNADRLMWDLRQRRSSEWLSIRDDAVRRAAAAGHTVQELADALQMRPTDVDRILARAV